MASKVKSGKLTTTVSESVVINGVEQKYNNVRTVAGINNVSHRIVRTDASGTELTLMNFAASADAGQFIDGQAKYIRITNLDDTNLLRLLVKDAAGIATFHLAAGETMVFNNQKYDARNDADLNSVAYTDIDSISVFGRDAADAANAAVDVEYFVAAIQS